MEDQSDFLISLLAKEIFGEGDEWAVAAGTLLKEIYRFKKIDAAGRAKRRLVFSTQLMQQLLLHPICFLSDNLSCCDSVVPYSIARTLLGEACNMLLCMPTTPPPHDDVILFEGLILRRCKKNEAIFEHLRELKRIAERLENDFRSVVEGTMREVKLEEEEVKRYSLMTHLALFHSNVKGRSGEKTGTRFLRRAAATILMPKNTPIPDVECTSL